VFESDRCVTFTELYPLHRPDDGRLKKEEKCLQANEYECVGYRWVVKSSV